MNNRYTLSITIETERRLDQTEIDAAQRAAHDAVWGINEDLPFEVVRIDTTEIEQVA